MARETDAEERQAPVEGSEEDARREGGDAACWAHLVCPECGSVVSEDHREGCSSPADQRPNEG